MRSFCFVRQKIPLRISRSRPDGIPRAPSALPSAKAPVSHLPFTEKTDFIRKKTDYYRLSGQTETAAKRETLEAAVSFHSLEAMLF